MSFGYPICFDTPLGAAKETPKRVPKQTGTKMPSFQNSKTCHFDTPSVLIHLWVLLSEGPRNFMRTGALKRDCDLAREPAMFQIHL